MNVGDPNWAAVISLAFVLLSGLVGAVVWFVRLEGKANAAKDAAAAAAIAAEKAVTVAAAAIKEEASAAEKAALATAAAIKEEASKLAHRVSLCEAGHAATAGELNAMRVDIAILRERSDAQVKTLERIESAVIPASAARARRRPTGE